MNFTEYIGQYERAEQAKLQTVPAFFTRLKLARRLLEGKDNLELNRNLMTPHYLSDLGVRRLEDAKEYACFISQEFETELPDYFSLVKELQQIPIDKLKYWLDIVVLLTGDYASLTSVILRRCQEILSSGDYRLLLYSGTLMAAGNNQFYQEIFRKAYEMGGITNEERLVMLHRLAVSELKRKKDFDSFQDIISEILSHYKYGNYKDFLVVLPLINNLYGLYMVKNKISSITLGLIMVNADMMLQIAYSQEDNSNRKDMIMRYLGQVAINRAQVCLFNDDINQSKKILEFALKRGLEVNSEYVGEIYALLAFLEYKYKNYTQSLNYAREALKRYRLIGHTSGMKRLYKIMILSYSEQKCYSKVNRLVDLLQSNDRKLFL